LWFLEKNCTGESKLQHKLITLYKIGFQIIQSWISRRVVLDQRFFLTKKKMKKLENHFKVAQI